MNNVLIKIYVSSEVKDKVKKIAEEKNQSQSKVVRYWVEEHLGVEEYLDTLVFPEDEEMESGNGNFEQLCFFSED